MFFAFSRIIGGLLYLSLLVRRSETTATGGECNVLFILRTTTLSLPTWGVQSQATQCCCSLHRGNPCFRKRSLSRASPSVWCYITLTLTCIAPSGSNRASIRQPLNIFSLIPFFFSLLILQSNSSEPHKSNAQR